MIKNPVMFVTMVGAAVTTAEIFVSTEPKAFTVQITVWLWFTVLFANFAEAMAEGRGKAQANALRALAHATRWPRGSAPMANGTRSMRTRCAKAMSFPLQPPAR